MSGQNTTSPLDLRHTGRDQLREMNDEIAKSRLGVAQAPGMFPEPRVRDIDRLKQLNADVSIALSRQR